MSRSRSCPTPLQPTRHASLGSSARRSFWRRSIIPTLPTSSGSSRPGRDRRTAASTAQPKTATDWSHDGRYVLFNRRDPKLGIDIWALSLNGKAKPFPVIQTPFDEQSGQFSPDGTWIAYQSNESGRQDIYVQPFPGPGTRSSVSTNGDTHVRWRPDGKELFYLAPDGRLMAVPIPAAPSARVLDIGIPEPLFTPPIGGAVQQADYRHQYMASTDGQQFLLAAATDESTSPITVILNWKGRP
jgi:dipeptidyl aminopeptidase/acylaminoacyl peptidase